MAPTWCPPARNMAVARRVVVVLPSVPVMPMSRSRREG
jgi:hypothetical protein